MRFRWRCLILLLFLLTPVVVHAVSLFSVPVGKTTLELEFIDPYYLPLGWFIPFTEEPVPNLDLNKERTIYGHLLKRFFRPRFLVIEGSIYPLPLVGTAIKAWAPDFYVRANLFAGLNLVESITTGPFQEPYAVSLFFGNVVQFTPDMEKHKAPHMIKKIISTNREIVYPGGDTNLAPVTNWVISTNTSTGEDFTIKYDGKGYSGFLISYGSHHIHHNDLIRDDWLEMEIKLKGSIFIEHIHPRQEEWKTAEMVKQKITGKPVTNREISWSYRIGARIHFHPEIRNSIYLGMKRDHFDSEYYRFSLIYNSHLEVKWDLEPETFNTTRVLLLVGKKFPLRRSNIVPMLDIGVIWNVNDPYQGSLADPLDEWQFIVSPNIRF